MQVEVSAISGWMLSGWDLDPFDTLRIELRRIDFDTATARDYYRCEALFRALTSFDISLDRKPGSSLRVEAVRASKNSHDEDVVALDFGDAGRIELTAKEHIAFVY